MVKTTWLGLIKSEKAKNPGKSLGEIMKIASPKWKKMKKGGGDEIPADTPADTPADPTSITDVPEDLPAAAPASAPASTTGGKRKSKKCKGGKKRCKSRRKSCRRKK